MPKPIEEHVALVEIRWAGGPHDKIKATIVEAIDDLFESKLAELGQEDRDQFEAVSGVRFFVVDGKPVVT